MDISRRVGTGEKGEKSMALYFGTIGADGGLAYIPAAEVMVVVVEPSEQAPHGCILADAPRLHVEISLEKYNHALQSVARDQRRGVRTVLWP